MAVVVHVGRRSRQRYQTPVVVLRHGGIFYVMVLSARVPDWMRNLQAAGGGELRVEGERVTVGPPTAAKTADALEAASAIGRRLRRALATSTIYVRLEAI
jgi:deazaflavin-dependent oxidoreductase (nitroreductase family)